MRRKCCQHEILNEIKKHVNSTITITEAALVSPEQCVLSLPVTKQYSPNALHEKQLRFYPTKRKRERTQSCTKATLEEVKSTKEKLSNTDVVVCALCYKEDDKCSMNTLNGFNVKFGCTPCVPINMKVCHYE